MSGKRPVITITTDYGYQDHYVGALKGVILGINPEANVIDVSHAIAPADIMGGAWVISNAAFLYPPGTVHLGIVDPGVGSSRKGIIVQVDDQIFVGPDNGLFSFTFPGRKVSGYYLENPDYTREHISKTFHGRDIFAPVAAYASKGVEPKHFGPVAGKLETYKMPMPITDDKGIEGWVVHIDAYGNLITNISENELSLIEDKSFKIYIGNVILNEIVSTFSDVPDGEPAAIRGSSGMLEVVLNKGHAQNMLSVQKGDAVSIVFRS